MKRSTKFLAGLAATAIVSSAQAVTVAGVTWDPSSIFDFSATDSMIETIVGNVGDTLSGFAIVTRINNTDDNVFCASGCEVTYVFDGYTVSSNTAPGGAGNQLVFTGGTISIYADATPDYNGTSRALAADGVLFLQLAGALHYDPSTNAIGTLHSDPTPASTGIAGDGRGFLNVVGGAAAAYFDTNTLPIDTNGDLVADAFADFQFTSSFQLIPGGSFVDAGITYGIFGTNEIQGDSVAIPEPGTLSLFGLALLGAGALRRRIAR